MQKTRRLLALAVALLGLSGCPSSSTCSIGVGGPPSSQPVSLIMMGEQVHLIISPNSQAFCESGQETPEPQSLSVEVSGPDLQPIPSQATLGTPSSSAATVTFTPDKQGRYHLFAAFDPVGGTEQLDFYAARDRSAEAPVQTLPRSTCKAVERTQRGGWICDADFIRNGALEQRFTGSRLAVSGDVVWAVGPTQVLRLVDTGTSLELTGSLSHTQGSALFLLAAADELVILHGTTLQRITFDGSALASTGPTTWTPGTHSLGPDGLQGLLLRKGDQLATVSGSLSNVSLVILHVCPYQLVTGRFVRTAANCQLFSTEVVGFEPSALWTGSRFGFSDFFSELRRKEWNGTVLEDKASIPLGQNISLKPLSPESRNMVTPAVIPSFGVLNTPFSTFIPVYSASQGGIVLEALDSTLDSPYISPTLLWGPSPARSTSVRVRIRPSTP